MWPFNLFRKKPEPTPPARQRAYSGAVFNRLTADWITAPTSADAEIRTSLTKLRDRSRQLYRDHEYAKNAIDTIVTNVVGTGVGLQCQVRKQRGKKLDEEINDLIEEKWREWGKARNCDAAGELEFFEIEDMIVRSALEAGEVFIRMVPQAMGDMKIPLALELIEADFLDENYTDDLPNGNKIRQGVEKNKWGRAVAYHFWRSHPGDYDGVSIQGNRRRRVPAEEVIHLAIRKRPRQTRGVPVLASVIVRLHHLGGYEEAEVIAARASSAVMGFIESDEGQLQGDETVDNQRLTDFEPGSFKYLGKGERIQIPQLTRPGGQYEPFVRSQLRGLAAGTNQSYEAVSNDYSQSNYSSTRQALINDRDHYKRMQKWIVSKFHQRLYDRFLDLAVLSGEIKIPAYELRPEFYKAVKWLTRGWTWIDPAKEIEASKAAIRSGITTLSAVCAQSGDDWEDVLVQRKREVDRARELGLTLESDASSDALAGSFRDPDKDGKFNEGKEPKISPAGEKDLA